MIWTRDYPVNTLLITSGKRLGLVGLLGILQDIAGEHADKLGCGYEQMQKGSSFWVLSRQRVVMEEWPRWNDTVHIRTWARPLLSGITALRDFEILVGETKVGECVTGWLMLDARTRRPVKPTFDPTRMAVRTDFALSFEAGKLAAAEGLNALSRVEVQYSDMDMNGHVNNTRYAQWILDAIPLEMDNKQIITEYEVNFLAETGFKDTVVLNYAPVPSQIPGQKSFRFQGVREKDGKAAFTARILVKIGVCP